MFYGPASENAKTGQKPPSPPPPTKRQDDSDSLDSLSTSEDCSSDDELDEDEEDMTKILNSIPAGIQVVRVPDCSGSAFNNLTNYIYSNFDFSSIKLKDENVMQTLYAGRERKFFSKLKSYSKEV